MSLIAENLSKRFGSHLVVRDVSLAVHPGEVVGLLGPNGAGKTTTFRMLAGILRPESGRITLEGRRIERLPLFERARCGLGYVPQQLSVFRELSAARNLEVALERRGLPRRERRRRRDELLEELGLSEHPQRLARELSGGQKRRLEVARGLAAAPSLLLFDEPFAGVDPIGVADLIEVIDALRRRGLGVLLCDHDAEAVLAASDRVVLLCGGEVLVEGSSAEVRASALARQRYLRAPIRSPGSTASSRHGPGRRSRSPA